MVMPGGRPVVIGILASRADEASIAIARELLASVTGERVQRPLEDRYRLDDAEVVVVDELHIELTDVDSRFETEPAWIAVVSRHAGDTGPLLTAHIPGNIDHAEFGGDPRTVPPACPRALGAYLLAIEQKAPAGYDVGIECTHHGPTDTTTPIMFVEVGSDVEQWRDQRAARAVAAALWSVRSVPARGQHQLVGLGGGHYAPRFDRIIRETAWDVGHIAPDWALDGLGHDTLCEILPGLFEATGTEYAVIVGDRPSLADTVESLGYRVVSERWVRATSRLSATVVEHLEAELAGLEAGLAFGDRTVDTVTAIDIVEVTPSLLADCASIDAEATINAVEDASVAFELDGAGSTPAGPIALADRADLEGLIDSLLDILTEKYEHVDRTDGTIVASRRSFDPAAAAEAGVPEGPLFGRLADGEAVTVDGRRVEPGDVTTERTLTYELPPDV